MLNIFRSRPLFAQYAITYRCNSRCQSCAYWQKPCVEELPSKEVSHLAEELWNFGIRIVTVTGGEPFLREDALDIIRLLQARGFCVTINTNGTVLDTAAIDRLSVLKRLHIVVSLDSLDEQTYSDIRGGHFLPRVLKVMSILKHNTPHEVRAFTVVSSSNYREVPALLEFCRNNGYRLSCYPAMSGPRNKWFASHDMIDRRDRGRIADLFDDLARQSRSDSTLFGFSVLYRGAARFLRGESLGACGAGRVTLQVSPDGSVSVCPEMEPFCDIRKESLSEAYGRNGWRRGVKDCYTTTPCYIGCTRMLQSICNSPLRFLAETAFQRLHNSSDLNW